LVTGRPGRKALLFVAVGVLLLVPVGSGSANTTVSMTISPPSQTVQADRFCISAYCAVAYYSTDATGGVGPPYTYVCNLESGQLFLVGDHQIQCWARDSAGDSSPMATASITVLPPGDSTPPVISDVPGPITVTATSSAGAVVTFATPTAMDAVDGPVPVDCDHSSGDTYPVGKTTVTCTATDHSGNTASAGFTVTVQSQSGSGSGGGSGGSGGQTPPPAPVTTPATAADMTAPTMSPLLPVVVDATSPKGGIATFTVAASDVDNESTDLAITCSPSSGTVFPLGAGLRNRTTVVTCGAHDPAGNASPNATFEVTVLGVAAQLTELERAVRRSHLVPRKKATLEAPLVKAARAFAAGSRSGARSMLLTFSKDVRGLPPALSRRPTAWIGAATRIRAVLG
jgi:hypothetical protein